VYIDQFENKLSLQDIIDKSECNNINYVLYRLAAHVCYN